MSDAASCRILVISPTAVRAHQFVERVQALSASRQGLPAPSEKNGQIVATSVSTSSDPLAAGSRTSIPWTIVNKYYTADVHFETHEFEHFKVHHAIGVPAIIYVWGPGEPFREHIPEIATKVQHYDPEVSLAVRLGDDAAVPLATVTSATDEADGLDEFLSSHGFEFIEGERSYRRPTQDSDRHSDDEDSGIPGLPRVIDALSTIMWPSIVQSEATRKRKSRARDLIGWALEEEADDGLRALIADPAAPSPSSDATNAVAAAAALRKSRMQREMEELERWLEDEETESGLKYSRGNKEGKAADPAAAEADENQARDEEAAIWVSTAPVSSADGWEDMLTPPAIRTPRADQEHYDGIDSEHGFDDDFADFVSGASHPHPHGFGSTDERLLEVNYDVARLTPMHTGMSYRSMSDFGGDDSMFTSNGEGEYGALGDEDEEDPDLPSRAEILETSRRIFGSAAFVPAPETESTTASTSTSSSTIPSAGPAPAGSTPTTPSRQTPNPSSSQNSVDISVDAEDGEGDESFAAFDLSRVFSALQGMKDEIAGMEDEGERRRAAARVALGLVYGLGVSGDGSEKLGHAATGGA